MDSVLKAANFCIRRPIHRLLALTTLFLFSLHCYYLGYMVTVPRRVDDGSPVLVKTTNKTKTILIWNAHARIELEVFGEGSLAFQSCPINQCFITQNRSMAPLSQFDAIVFNMPPLSVRVLPIDEHRRLEQRYIFFSQEPPTYIGEEADKFNHFFNWTMSYPAHSDIRYSYGDFYSLSVCRNGLEKIKFDVFVKVK